MDNNFNAQNCGTSGTNRTNGTSGDTQDIGLNSRFEPICVKKARECSSPEALKVILSWAKRRGLTESQRLSIAKTFLKVHNLDLSPDKLLELLDVPQFSCDYVRNLGFCKEEECAESLHPADRLIIDTESVLLFHSTSELDIKIAGRREIIPIKKIAKQGKDGMKVNVALFNELFLKCYYIPPNPPFDEESALKVYQSWVDNAVIVREPFDVESSIEEAVIEVLTTKREFYDVKLLKEGKVPPKRGFFVEGDIILVDSELLKELLEEVGVYESMRKVAKSVRRLLANPNRASIRLRIKEQRRYFWAFNLEAIKAILKREGEDWTPEVKKEDDFSKAIEEIGGDFIE
ncbi:hypothetical protein [Archaeoglobus profundus]|uniref:Uncharacterized protein n=1 Tax=Archaeoglobus profundus (strain DSM 5631 / JCM 9629 / NBRC 100127 / Av18) TaxID=572546 RepID=D2RFX0_ARCPA|nr:hypothetical protein [Archaeoglobus profundus]ADB57195.1 hypothetical protein Arcpr_0123 [Archaeoglobus profundus DSM 5631]